MSSHPVLLSWHSASLSALCLMTLHCVPPGEEPSSDTGTLTGTLAAVALRPVVNTALCLEAGPASSYNGLEATIAACNGGSTQAWTYTNGTLRVGNRCLDVNGGVDTNGTKIHLWECMAGNANQQWVRQGKRWVWAQHNKCLHVDGSKGVAGTVVHLWTCDLQRGQEWTDGGTGVCQAPPTVPTPTDPGVGMPMKDPALSGQTHRFFKITVLDAATRAPIAGARLKTVNKVVHTSDDNGVVAFYEPGVMDQQEVWFGLEREGYEVPADFFGNRGKALRPSEGGSAEVTMNRTGTPPAKPQGNLQTRLAQGTVPGPDRCLTLRVYDPTNNRGVPLVTLTTPWGDAYVTDSQGIIAYCDPDHLGAVDFTVTSHGYSVPTGKVRVSVQWGQTVSVAVERLNIAERLYRVTGGGLYRDSILLGLKTPLRQPVLNAKVFGQDSVISTVYKGKIFWTWGDTDRVAYPLGNFRTSAALSELPTSGGLNPNLGVNQTYYVDADGFSKGIVQEFAPTGMPTWVGALVSVPNTSGQETLFASYTKAQSDSTSGGRGLLRFNDTAQLFEPVITNYPLTDAANFPNGGQAFTFRGPQREHAHFGATLRIPATAESLLDRSTYEVFTAQKTDGSGQLEKASDGTLVYGWKKGGGVDKTREEQVAAAGLDKGQSLEGHQRDAATGAGLWLVGDSITWNEYRGRFVKIAQQLGGSTSTLGELWYAEGDTPMGPWVNARKIITHNRYTFYNAYVHPYFSPDGGRTMFLEATHTNTYDDPAVITPRYNYNQLMYRLSVDDARLALPVPIYDLGTALPGTFVTKQGVAPGTAPLAAPFLAPDRQAPGTVPVGWTGAACGTGRRLVAGGTPAEVLFYALPPTTSPLPPKTLPLYEYTHTDGRRAYSLNANLGLAGFTRTAQPLAYVWENPLRVKLPVADFRGQVVAQAGVDRCLTETAQGAGALVTLDASASRNLSDQSTMFTWQLPAGATSEAGTSCPSISGQVVTVRLPAGLHAVQLEARDGAGNVSTDNLLIQVKAL
ncbi:Ricin-type beta-trefoil lectin domain-containing protein [Stigmatella erecta]|uniref:Ricin-type beta-trefoil lectin domain-containing protein n=1 Tax=Stigmatella erecta TaxID=83460 RepID=A0A1I0B2F9_9BACT|nr:Ricin-type beta-trefoil lectin domain-containing protein [Stigmatella erecta]